MQSEVPTAAKLSALLNARTGRHCSTAMRSSGARRPPLLEVSDEVHRVRGSLSGRAQGLIGNHGRCSSANTCRVGRNSPARSNAPR